MDTLKDILTFIIKRKKFWLLPAIITLLLLGTIFVLSSGSALAPFIYSIF